MEKINVYDIAVFLSSIEISYLKERELIKEIYKDLSPQESSYEFMLKVDEQLEQLDAQVVKEMSELQQQRNLCLSQDSYPKDMSHYLKVMKLKLHYTESDYVKIKLRTLLKQLGYRRRSDKLILELNEAFSRLDLVVYQKGGTLGDLLELSLDDFLTIRLRSEYYVETTN